jgi:hypothetical protein
MPTFKPFRGVRPHNDFVDVFPTHPIENFLRKKLTKKQQKTRLTFKC